MTESLKHVFFQHAWTTLLFLLMIIIRRRRTCLNVSNTAPLTRPQVLAEMCQSGYKDALRFLQENSECLLLLLSSSSSP